MVGGDGEVVEIDESLLIKRKHNRGTMRAQHQQWSLAYTTEGQRRDECSWLQGGMRQHCYH